MTPALSQIIVASGEHAEEGGGHPVVNDLIFEPIWFGVLALVVFAALLGMLMAFRNSLALDPHVEGHARSDLHGTSTH